MVGLLIAMLAVLGYLKLQYGGGASYPDVSTDPAVAESGLETLVTLDYPPGNVAVAADGRIFFAYHPFAKAERFTEATVFELVDGKPKPFPDLASQSAYQGVFGMTVDGQNRLWLIEPASLDHASTRLLAFDLRTNRKIFEHRFAAKDVQFGQDLRVTPDGENVLIADTGLFRFTKPGLTVLHIASKTTRTVLGDAAAAGPEDWVIRTQFGPHKLAFGLITFSVGLDGIALSRDGAWLYFGAMSHHELYKVPVAAVLKGGAELNGQVQLVGRKPLSDGIAVDGEGGILITDIEHGGIARMDEAGGLKTLVKSPKVIWADGVAVNGDGAVLFTDSAIPAYIDALARPPAKARLEAARPYAIYRFRPGR